MVPAPRPPGLEASDVLGSSTSCLRVTGWDVVTMQPHLQRRHQPAETGAHRWGWRQCLQSLPSPTQGLGRLTRTTQRFGNVGVTPRSHWSCPRPVVAGPNVLYAARLSLGGVSVAAAPRRTPRTRSPCSCPRGTACNDDTASPADTKTHRRACVSACVLLPGGPDPQGGCWDAQRESSAMASPPASTHHRW